MHRPVAETALEPIFLMQGTVRAVAPVVNSGGLVIHRHPDVTGIERQPTLRLRRPYLMERQDELIGADVHLVLAERADAGVLVAIVGDVHHQVRRLAAHERIGRLEPAARRRFAQQPVHDRRVRGVDAAFQTLEPVALLDHFRHVAIGFRRLRPGEFRHRRHVLDRTEICPDDAAEFARRIRGEAHLVLEVILRRFVHHVGAGAGDVELPAVIDAAQTALFVATEV